MSIIDRSASKPKTAKRKTNDASRLVHSSKRLLIRQITEDLDNPNNIGKYNIHFAIHEPGTFYEHMGSMKHMTKEQLIILSSELNTCVATELNSNPAAGKKEEYNRFAEMDYGED